MNVIHLQLYSSVFILVHLNNATKVIQWHMALQSLFLEDSVRNNKYGMGNALRLLPSNSCHTSVAVVMYQRVSGLCCFPFSVVCWGVWSHVPTTLWCMVQEMIKLRSAELCEECGFRGKGLVNLIPTNFEFIVKNDIMMWIVRYAYRWPVYKEPASQLCCMLQCHDYFKLTIYSLCEY